MADDTPLKDWLRGYGIDWESVGRYNAEMKRWADRQADALRAAQYRLNHSIAISEGDRLLKEALDNG